jgi:hypothetical protein
MIGMKKTLNAERRTPNIESSSALELDVRRWALGVGRFLFIA